MTAGAVRETAAILRERIVAIAAHKLEAAAEDIELADSRAQRARHARRSGVSFAEIAALAYFEPALAAARRARRARGERALHRRQPVDLGERHARVHVRGRRRRPGRSTLLRYIVSEDCGPMINPNVVEGQIAGGVVQGIGGVLFEHLAYDDDGNPLATTFMDYLLPTAAEVPIIEYGHIETPSPGPGGYKGVGEGGAIGAPPAVVNAVADALAPFGVTVTRLPLSPSRIVALLEPQQRNVTVTVTSHERRRTTTRTTSTIDADPYPVFRRLREEAPLYYNEQYDFYAVSRYDDVERGLVDRETLHLRAGRHPRADQGGHRDAARRPHLRGPADAHHPPRPAVAGVHAEEDERARAEDPRVLRDEPRPAGRRRTGSTSSPTSARRCRCG